MAAYDPVAARETERALGGTLPRGLRLADHARDALRGADALLLVTEWKEFRTPDFDAIKAALKQPVVFDGRNQYDPVLMKAFGIEHHGIGRGLPL
ncbi:MAG: hypothetical protein CFE45_23160 [Burkholderiales bacterium PBB5]|nr:MAG: hypothetical protein CFE45_23160 [Burkholderiales bacterium PBB5]